MTDDIEQWKNSVDRAFDDIRELRHEVAAKDAEIERLRGEAARLRRSLHEAIIHGNRQSGRAERLAEALRDVVADMREWGEPAKGAHVERTQRRLDDALRGHDQED